MPETFTGQYTGQFVSHLYLVCTSSLLNLYPVVYLQVRAGQSRPTDDPKVHEPPTTTQRTSPFLSFRDHDWFFPPMGVLQLRFSGGAGSAGGFSGGLKVLACALDP